MTQHANTSTPEKSATSYIMRNTASFTPSPTRSSALWAMRVVMWYTASGTDTLFLLAISGSFHVSPGGDAAHRAGTSPKTRILSHISAEMNVKRTQRDCQGPGRPARNGSGQGDCPHATVNEYGDCPHGGLGKKGLSPREGAG